MPPEEPPPISRIPDLNRFERKLLGTVICGAISVGSLGLYSSYHAVGNAAANWGFNPNWILPAGLDVSIPVFSLGYLLLIRFDMALAWVRFVPWALTLVTVYLNIKAAGDNRAAQVGHGALPLLWVICSEIAAHVYRVLIGAATGRRMERVRRSRWILAPFSTFFLWRRMVLWEVVSYRTGLALERERRMIRASYRQEHGPSWRRKVTRQQLAALKLGELAPAKVTKTLPVLVPVAPAKKALEQAVGDKTQPYKYVPLKPRVTTPLAGPVGTPAWDAATGGKWVGPHAPLVYFVVVANKVKIGFSRHLANRLRELALPMENLALVLHGTRQLESDLHRQFAEYRLSTSEDRVGTTEWFAIQGELAVFLANHGVTVASSVAASARTSELATAVPGNPDDSGDSADEIATSSDSGSPAPNDKSSGGRRARRRKMEEWLELATPIYHREFQKRRKQPTGEEFAEAIELAGYGAVSPSTAKNIRTAIQDEEAKSLATR